MCNCDVLLQFDALEAAAEHMAVPLAQLQQEIESYASAAAGNTKDAFGKQHFPTAIQADLGPFWVAKITPVVHYTMGGLEINDKAQVRGIDLRPFMQPGFLRGLKGMWCDCKVERSCLLLALRHSSRGCLHTCKL